MTEAPNAWEGRLVRLRAIEPDDWKRFHAFDKDSEAQRAGWEIHFPRSEQAARKWAEDKALATPDGDNAMFAIETMEGILAGSVNVHGADRRNGTFEYGISLGRDHWGKGLAADALRIVFRHYFRELRYQKVNATVYAFNEPSIALHRKFGFVEEGRIRRNHYTGSEYHDELWFGMTAEEFEERERAR